jgi:hypothetical protein
MEKTNNEEFNKKLFTDHLIITFSIAFFCWGLCIILGLNGITKETHAWINIPYVLGALFHMIVNAVPESIRYDIYSSYIASTITAIVLILVSLIVVKLQDI